MNVKHPLPSRWARRSVAGLVLVFLVIAMFWSPNAIGQQPSLPKLTLGQIEQLVSHGVPDSTMAAQIQKRGLAFTPTPANLDELRAKGAGPLTLAEIDASIPNGAARKEARPPAPTTNATVTDQTQLTLDLARRSIPAIVTKIYRSLDDGDPQAARQFLSGDVLNNTQTLDAICMPFSYRGHYISSVIERPGPIYEARVRALFKPSAEKAQVFSFQPSMGSFMLLSVEKDPMTAEIDTAKESVRQFIFAVRAGRWDVAARYASPGLPLEQMKKPEWADYFSKITSANISSNDIRTQGGLLLLIRVDVRSYSSYLPDFLVDPESGQIVRAFFRSPENIYSQLPDPAGFTDPNTETNFLQRFALPTATNKTASAPASGSSGSPGGAVPGPAVQQEASPEDGVYHVGGTISTPTILYGPEAEFSDEARREHYQGDCLVSLVVDAQGNPQDIKVVRPLGKGLDEKAIEAVKKYRFKPAMRNGITPVPVRITVAIHFSLY